MIDREAKKQSILKGLNRNNINILRDTSFEDIVVKHNGYSIDAHEKARFELNSMVTHILVNRAAGKIDELVIWTTSDDQDIEFTYDDIIAISQLSLAEYSAIHIASRNAKKLL